MDVHPTHQQGVDFAALTALPPEWETWVFANLTAGLEAGVLVEMLVECGFATELAQSEVARVRAHPFVDAAMRPYQQLRKLHSILAAKQQLANLDSRRLVVERKPAPSREVFLRDHYAANRPVILTGLLRGESALQRWTPDYISEACAEAMVEVMSGRDADPKYEIRSDAHRQSMRLADYIERICSVESSNDCYLVANNHFFDAPETAILRDEIPALARYIDPGKSAGSNFLWLGPAGTITPFHHDVMNVMVAMISGSKRFTLISPEQTPLMYNNLGVYSDVDAEHPDLNSFPLYRDVRPITVDLHRGDVLFLPVGWWHHVRSLELSIMVSYTNFVFPNEFTWNHPWLE